MLVLMLMAAACASAAKAPVYVSEDSKAEAVELLAQAIYKREEGQLGIALDLTKQALAKWPTYEDARTFLAEVAPQATAAARSSFSRLELEAIERNGGRIVVRGSTDLPDGASLLITLEAVERQPRLVPCCAQATVNVQRGRFEAVFGPFVTPELGRPPHTVDVIFTPRGGQPQRVLDVVGKNGEYLTGPQAEKTELGFTVLTVKQRVVVS